MGYGMRWSDFGEKCQPHLKRDPSSALYSIMDKVEGLITTTEDRAVLKAEGRSLSQNFNLLAEYHDNKIVRTQCATDLYVLVYEGDYPQAIIFFPSISARKDWYRSDSDLDYALGNFISDDPYNMDTRIHWPIYGWYPYSPRVMHKETGRVAEWDGPGTLERNHALAPDVPAPIVWYMRKLNILADDGIFSLRPIVARWWNI